MGYGYDWLGVKGYYNTLYGTKFMDKEIRLNLPKKVGVTSEVFAILSKEKKKQKKSRAKLVCELVLKYYN